MANISIVDLSFSPPWRIAQSLKPSNSYLYHVGRDYFHIHHSVSLFNKLVIFKVEFGYKDS